jgi:hypothetical protein
MIRIALPALAIVALSTAAIAADPAIDASKLPLTHKLTQPRKPVRAKLAKSTAPSKLSVTARTALMAQVAKRLAIEVASATPPAFSVSPAHPFAQGGTLSMTFPESVFLSGDSAAFLFANSLGGAGVDISFTSAPKTLYLFDCRISGDVQKLVATVVNENEWTGDEALVDVQSGHVYLPWLSTERRAKIFSIDVNPVSPKAPQPVHKDNTFFFWGCDVSTSAVK